MSCFVRLRALDNGMLWLSLAFLGTWACDSGAYFVGIRYGKHRFFPAISPKKTQEGAIGGLVFGLLAVVLLGYCFLALPLGLGHGARAGPGFGCYIWRPLRVGDQAPGGRQGLGQPHPWPRRGP